jgi:hypothetical protein
MVTFTQFLIILTILYVAWIYYKQTQFEKDFEALKQLIDARLSLLSDTIYKLEASMTKKGKTK